MRVCIEAASLLMFTLSSGAFYRLIMEGGANDLGFMYVQYTGPLNYLPTVWVAATAAIVLWALYTRQFTLPQLDGYWLPVIAYAFASTLWVEYKKTSFNSSLFILLSYLLVAIHANVCGIKRVLRLYAIVFVIILLGSFILALLIPSYGISIGQHDGKWQGAFTHKNTLGNFSALMFVLFIWSYRLLRKPLLISGMAATTVLVVASECSTAISSVILTTTIFLLLRIPLVRQSAYRYRHIVVASFLLVSLLLVYIALEQTIYFEFFGKESTFTSRDRIWSYVLDEIKDAPWFGHGLSQLSANNILDDSNFRTAVGFVVLSTHNGFLDLVHSIGILGSLLFFLAPIRLIQRIPNNPAFELAVMYMCYLFTINTFESQLFGFNVSLLGLVYISYLAPPDGPQPLST